MAQFFVAWDGVSAPAVELSEVHPGELSAADGQTDFRLSWGEPNAAPESRRRSPVAGRSVLKLDRSGGVLSAQIDPFGAYPAVFATNGPEFLVASDLGILLERRPELASRLDVDGVLELLCLDQNLGAATPWQGVRNLGGGASLAWSPSGGVIVTPAGPLVLPDSAVSPGDALDCLVEAVARRLRTCPETVIPISGGLDSRLLLACALAAGDRPETFSYGDPASADRRIAGALAQAVGVRLHAPEHILELGERERAEIARVGGGGVPISHGHSLPGSLSVPEIVGRPILTGTGAETFRAFYYDRGMPGMSLLGAVPPRGGLPERATRWVIEHMAGDRLATLAQAGAAELTERQSHRLHEAVSATLRAAPDLARGLDAVYLQHRVGRFVVGGQQLLNPIHARMHPFLDQDVVQALSGLPIGWRLGARFHRWAVQRLAPDLAAVAWDRTNRPLSGGLFFSERYPGLAQRLGLKAPYAKAGAALLDTVGWAEGLAPNGLLDESGLGSCLGQHEEGALRAWFSRIPRARSCGVLTSLATLTRSQGSVRAQLRAEGCTGS